MSLMSDIFGNPLENLESADVWEVEYDDTPIDLAEQVKELHKRIDHLENMIRHYIALYEGDHK